jgi:hypothetical protein
MANGAGESTLAVRLSGQGTTRPDSFALEFLVEMDFSPSSGNYCTVSLLNEATEGTMIAGGVYMRFGGAASGTDDTWTGSAITGGDLILGDFMGTTGALGESPALVRFRVTYVFDRGYQFFADYTGGRDFQLQGEIAEDSWVGVDLLRINCVYTATRSDKFSFDDLNARYAFAPDNRAPNIAFARLVNPTRLQIRFDEEVRDAPLTDPANYAVSLAGNSVTAVERSDNTFFLTLAQPAPLREEFTVTVGEAIDLAGNAAAGLVRSFVYDPTVRPDSSNLIINEIMFAPTPAVGLPAGEYLELYNPTEEVVNLFELEISSGSTRRFVNPGARVPPGGYVVFVKPEFVDALAATGANVVALNLPQLNNTGDDLSIGYAGRTLQTVNYTDDWYNDPERNEGGYSIEYIGGADAGCSASWRASLDLAGGTPGRVNSVLGMPTDVAAPAVAEVEVDPFGITLTFDEVIDPAQFSPALFTISPELSVGALSFPDERTVFLSADVRENQLYTLTILPDFSDCAGNFPIAAIELTLAIPTQPEPGDVVINEILFNPASGGSDFVELYNCSDKVFQVNGWQLINQASTSTSAAQTIDLNRLFLPGEYLTFTPDRDDILAAFLNVDPSLLLEQRLPTLGDDEGNITVSVGGTVLDAFDYTEDFHSELLSPNDGVSLERLRQKGTTQDGANWYSASSAENFGTPTRANSQRRDDLTVVGEQTFSLPNPTFSPDGDSFEDFLELQYATNRAGFLARVRIFDAQGRPVKTLRRTELLGTSGTLRWDGDNEEGQKAKAGLYVLYVELFSPEGEVREEKLVGVLAGGR